MQSPVLRRGAFSVGVAVFHSPTCVSEPCNGGAFLAPCVNPQGVSAGLRRPQGNPVQCTNPRQTRFTPCVKPPKIHDLAREIALVIPGSIAGFSACASRTEIHESATGFQHSAATHRALRASRLQARNRRLPCRGARTTSRQSANRRSSALVDNSQAAVAFAGTVPDPRACVVRAFQVRQLQAEIPKNIVRSSPCNVLTLLRVRELQRVVVRMNPGIHRATALIVAQTCDFLARPPLRPGPGSAVEPTV